MERKSILLSITGLSFWWRKKSPALSGGGRDIKPKIIDSLTDQSDAKVINGDLNDGPFNKSVNWLLAPKPINKSTPLGYNPI
jgi:hypothetical protein